MSCMRERVYFIEERKEAKSREREKERVNDGVKGRMDDGKERAGARSAYIKFSSWFSSGQF
jgi:hypothetical protein